MPTFHRTAFLLKAECLFNLMTQKMKIHNWTLNLNYITDCLKFKQFLFNKYSKSLA